MHVNQPARGFTIIELLVVIVVLGILLLVATNRFFGSQADARDVDRKADVDTIARRLEIVFADRLLGAASYPRTTDMAEGGTALTGIEPEALRVPGVTNSQTMSLTVATNATATTTGVLPQPTISQYVYQPLTAANALCNSSLVCVKFNLYYRAEASNTVIKIVSLNQ